ncbi:MAG: HD domain-containing protein [SAR324 cluster bacterium]|nr:HD domain-containing protein [SAR324 cluster bacterium]
MFVANMSPPQNRLQGEINTLNKGIEGNNAVDYDLIQQAVAFGKKAHQGQLRKNGDPYFIHPVRVAILALDYDLGTTSIVASLLHDVIEDTEYGEDSIKELFGETVVTLVEALTKVKESKSLTLFKIIELGKVDFRVILIKLLDRLDNMSDLKALTRRKQRSTSLETLNIYCEVAHGLGLIEVEEKLRDLIFKELYKKSYFRVKEKLTKLYQERIGAIDNILEAIKSSTSPEIVAQVTPVFVKAQAFLLERKDVDHILESVVIEVTGPTQCYQILGELHLKMRSVPLSIRDFISNPKANGWRGLTTKVMINGEVVSLQIVTQGYQEANRKGLITLIQEGVYQSENYQQFLQLYLDVAGDQVRIENVFRHNKAKTIQVMTPKGDVVELRYGSTILDFAFMIHTQLGFEVTGGIIDNLRYPREKILEDGMVVQVVTSSDVKPNDDWIWQAVMPKSRREILKYLSKH